jgi:hypothetical protein
MTKFVMSASAKPKRSGGEADADITARRSGGSLTWELAWKRRN